MIIAIGIVIFVFIWLILFLGIQTYNNFQIYIIRINEVESNIDSVIRNKFDLLNKSINVIKTVCDKEDVLTDITKLKSKKISGFELNRQLNNSINEFNNYKNKYESLESNEDFMKIAISLDESEFQIKVFTDKYNSVITEYNKLVKSFPSLIIAIIFKFKYKPYYDGKDMTDDDNEDFKL